MLVSTKQNKQYFRKQLKKIILDTKKNDFHFLKKELHLQKQFLISITSYLKSNKIIALYKNDQYEIDTYFIFLKLLKNNIKVALPIINPYKRILEFYLIKSHDEWNLYSINNNNDFLKIKERKVNVENISLFLIPLLGLSFKKHRLGRGGGYYDRTLNVVDNNKFHSLLFSEKQIVNFVFNSQDIQIKNTLFLK